MKTKVFWTPNDWEKTHDRLINLLELKSQNDIELHVEEVDKRGLALEILRKTLKEWEE